MTTSREITTTRGTRRSTATPSMVTRRGRTTGTTTSCSFGGAPLGGRAAAALSVPGRDAATLGRHIRGRPGLDVVGSPVELQAEVPGRPPKSTGKQKQVRTTNSHSPPN